MESQPFLSHMPPVAISSNPVDHTGSPDAAEMKDFPPKWASMTSTTLPIYDYSRSTKLRYMVGLAIGWVTVFACGIAAIVLFAQGNIGTNFYLTEYASKAISFGINVYITLLTDCFGSIHANSLRWALYREDRLKFNTNIRLFTSARKSLPNHWPANSAFASCLILSYAATSQLFWPSDKSTSIASINCLALATLSLSLLGQAIIVTWSLRRASDRIMSWSSNPLNNTLALLHRDLKHETGRCMLSVHLSNLPHLPVRPRKRQRSLLHANTSVRYIVYLLWAFAILSAVGVVVVTYVVLKQASGGFLGLYKSWVAGEQDSYSGKLEGDIPLNIIAALVVHILIACAVQGGQTMGLHAVELIVDMVRDEKTWRSASRINRARGAQICTSILGFSFASFGWENMVLFTAKAGLHWLLGQSIPKGTNDISVVAAPLLVYVVSVIVLAIFATYLALRRPKGPQPSTYGHFQTLANVIDDWEFDKNGNLWWGDKGVSEGVRHAGTSGQKSLLGPIQMEAEYAGWITHTPGDVKVKIC